MSQPLHQQLPNLFIFQQVAKHGSFQAAADRLDLTRSAVSKKVAQLEQHLNQRLLQRSTRRLRLTNAGEALLQATSSLDQLLSDTAQLQQSRDQPPCGSVRISSSTLIGERYLMPLLPELRRNYPQVTLDISLQDRVEDLIEQGIDIAVRVGQLPDSSLVARQIGVKTWGCFASPKYLQQNGEPTDPGQLKDHACLVFRHQSLTMDHWQFCDPEDQTGSIQTEKVEPVMTTDDARALVGMACQGLGIVRVDPLLIQPEVRSGQLVPILQRWHYPDSIPIHLVCLGRNARTRAASAVWQFFAERLLDR